MKKSIALDPDNRYQSVSELEMDYRKSIANHMVKSKKTKDSYILPGLQNPSKTKRFMAFTGYIFMMIFVFNTTLKDTTFITPIEEFLFRVILLILCLMLILIPCNYHDILTFTPLYKSKRRWIRFLNGIIIWYIVLIVLAFAFALMRGIFSSLL